MVLYIGKSLNIRDRVYSHLRNKASRKTYELAASIADVGFELNGNELIALLLESDEIKLHKPLYNRAQRRTGFAFGLFVYEDRGGYFRINIDKSSSTGNLITTFHTPDEAREFLEKMIDKFHLCQKFCGLYETAGACFYRQVNKCMGACTGSELPDSYNERVRQLMDYCQLGNESFLIIGEGRNNDEFSVVKINKGAYSGFAFFDQSTQMSNWSEIANSIPTRIDNRDARMIIKNYLLKHPKTKIVKI